MSMNFVNYEALMAGNAFEGDRNLADRLFLKAIEESLNYHIDNCPAFGNLCRNKDFAPGSSVTNLADIPFLPTQAFKTFGRDLLITKMADERSFFMQSSATSGQPSSINVSRSGAKRQALSMAKVVSSFLGSKKRPFIIFDVNPQRASSDTVGARYGATVGYMSFSSEAHFVLKESAFGTIEFDLEAFDQAISAVAASGTAPVIFGFTYVMFEVLSKLKSGSTLARFPEGSVLHIGGWKKLEAQSISKKQFNKMAGGAFGINPSNVIDAYGFTEQMGLNYFSADLNDKVAPNFARVLVRDPETLNLLPDGEEGLLQFITPLPLSYPGVSVITDDLGIITNQFGEIDGRYGTTFKITGRAKNAEIRGCGDIMSSYLRREPEGQIAEKSRLLKPRLLFLNESLVKQHQIETKIEFDSLPEITDLRRTVDLLTSRLHSLHKYSVDDLISFFSITSKSWLDADSPMRHLQQHGLSFLVNWLSADNLRAMTNKSLKGNRVALDRFVPDNEFPIRLLRAVPRGVVGHWLAGNVPLLGMLGLVQSILTKNANIIRVPAVNSAVMPILLDVIAKSTVELPSGIKVIGRDIADTVAILYYDKADSKFANTLSMCCDARIAWGGADAVAAVSALSTKTECQTIIYGPKLSYMAIGGESLSSEKNLDKLFRRIATDCSVFDQYACASPHTIFVEANDHMTAEVFCDRLGKHMQQAEKRIPKGPIDAGTASKVLTKRVEYDLCGKSWQSAGTTWTVALGQAGEGLSAPTYSRFITVVPVDDIHKAAHYATPDIQTISLAMDLKNKIKFAEIAARNGAIRFPDVGRMTHFEAPWDGSFLMDRLVRFVSLGGPMI